ncbi:hypothetical protein RB195_014732 [Necator americanus]|uniref:Endonuclease/exonuclease/phosphatase domain-containing protein n=1 Tax=Necator americanus TaxID=51031 RepID=A0ABR1E1E9_NECAM
MERTRLAICTYNARTLASEAAIEDLMMQAKKINYDTTTRIGRLRMRRCGPTPALTIFVAYAPTSSYEEGVEAFYVDLEKFYREDHAFYKVIIGDFNAKSSIRDRTIDSSEEDFPSQGRAEKAVKFRERNPRTIINWDLFATLAGFWEDSAMDNIDEEYDRPVEHLHDCAKKAESFETTKRRLSLETLELIRQRGAARAAGNQELTSELANLCREAIKEDLKERRTEVLAEAAEAGKSIRCARRDFASRKTRMNALRNPKRTTFHCLGILHSGRKQVRSLAGVLVRLLTGDRFFRCAFSDVRRPHFIDGCGLYDENISRTANGSAEYDGNPHRSTLAPLEDCFKKHFTTTEMT